MIHFVIVNINGLRFTRPLSQDLLNQTKFWRATLLDQASTEPGTAEFLATLNYPFDVIRNAVPLDLNRIWDWHYRMSQCPYLCFLNNDVRIPSNFVADTEAIFELEPSVGCVIHSTNHPDYQDVSPVLRYEVMNDRIAQGWDFTLRREAYTVIPDDLKTFGGDDYLFANLYEKGWKVAVALSSPIVHYYARSRRYYKGSREEEGAAYRRHNYAKMGKCPYSRRFPVA